MGKSDGARHGDETYIWVRGGGKAVGVLQGASWFSAPAHYTPGPPDARIRRSRPSRPAQSHACVCECAVAFGLQPSLPSFSKKNFARWRCRVPTSLSVAASYRCPFTIV